MPKQIDEDDTPETRQLIKDMKLIESIADLIKRGDVESGERLLDEAEKLFIDKGMKYLKTQCDNKSDDKQQACMTELGTIKRTYDRHKTLGL